MKSKTKKSVFAALTALVIAGVLFVLGMSLLEWNFDRLDGEQWTQKVYEQPAVELPLTSAEIDISRSRLIIEQGDQLKVEYVESDFTSYDINVENGKLTIRENSQKDFVFIFFLFRFHNAVMKVTLPEVDVLKIRCLNSGISISDRTLDSADLSTTNEKIDLQDVTVNGDLKAATTNGSLSFKNVTAADIRGETTNGAVRAENVKAGSLTLSSTNGSLYLGGVNAEQEVRVTTTNARAELQNVDAAALYVRTTNARMTASVLNVGRMRMETTNGRMELSDVDVSGETELRTTNADVKAALAGVYEDYSVDCSTTNGSVNFPNRQGGSRKLYIRTTNGSVNLTFER